MAGQPMSDDVAEAQSERLLLREAMDFAEELAGSPVTSIPRTSVDLLAANRFAVDELDVPIAPAKRAHDQVA